MMNSGSSLVTIDIWNRAAEGDSAGAKTGDIHLAHALFFHGYAEGSGCLAAVEAAGETETGLHDCKRAFEFFALADVTEKIDDVFQRWNRALVSGKDSEMDRLESAASQEYAALDVEVRLSEALERIHDQSPESFAAV